MAAYRTISVNITISIFHGFNVKPFSDISKVRKRERAKQISANERKKNNEIKSNQK